MANKRSLDERIHDKDVLMQQALSKVKEYEAQIKQLEKRKKEEERRARTHRLITIGGVVGSVLGRDFVEGDDMRLMNFLKQQERNGGYFSKAMNKGAPDTAKKDDSEVQDKPDVSSKKPYPNKQNDDECFSDDDNGNSTDLQQSADVSTDYCRE